MGTSHSPGSGDQLPQKPLSGTTFQSTQWIRKINYVAKEGADAYPRTHSYTFTTLDTIKDEHKTAIALLDATDCAFGYAVLKDIGSKAIDTISHMVVYTVLHRVANTGSLRTAVDSGKQR